MNYLTEQELDRTIKEVVKRAVVDETFRVKAIADGNAAIAGVGGKQPPAGITFKFVDNSKSSTKVIVLPDSVAEPLQLTEVDLEAVAGGCNGTGCSNSCLHT